MSDAENNKELIDRHNRHDLVTRAECEQILEMILKEQNVDKGVLREYEIVPELSTIGYLGEYFHLYLKYQKGEDTELTQLRLFVKTRPYQNPDMSDFIERSGMLKKESTLYQKLLNELKKLTPSIWCAQCYLVKTDLFVMQNIIDLGYEPLKDSAVFLNKPQICSILRGLASMHACSVGFEQKNQIKIGEWLKDVLYEVTVSPKVVWYTAGIKAVLAVALKHPLYQTEPLQNFIKTRLPSILDSVYDMVNPSEKYYNVFCHRDVWGGNVFFAKDKPYEKGAVFVDFQLCRYSPAAIDILMTLYLNMRPKDRKAIERDCHKSYYQNFSDELAQMSLKSDDFMTYNQFENSLRDLSLFGALYNCMAATILRVPGDYLKDMKLNRPDDFHRYTNVDRTDEVLELVKIDAKFRDYMLECIEDMMDLETELTQLRLFVKTKPYQNPEMLALFEQFGVLRKESNIYEKLLNELKKLTPNIWCARCYLVKDDLFVLQNIVDMGYEPVKDSSAFLTKPQIFSILKSLASLHACGIGFEQRNQISVGEWLKDELTVSPNIVMFTAGVKAVLAVALKHPLYQTEPLQNFIKARLPTILDSVYDMVNPSEKYYNVFCHRDVWGGNVFFAKDKPYDKGAVFVDFQLCRYSPAAIDILMTLYLNMRPKDRKSIEKEAYRLYYQNFSDELLRMSLKSEDFMTYNQFENSLRDLSLFGALYNCVTASILRVPGDYLLDMKLNRPADFYHYTNVDRTAEVLELFKSNVEFRDYMLECIEDMMDLVFRDYFNNEQ